MKLHHILVLMLMIACSAHISHAQESPINQLINDKAGNPMLVGECNRSALLQPPFLAWFQTQYDHYVLDSTTCKSIAPLLANKTITVFLGTWCGDSKREVPRILKMLDCCGFPPKKLTLIMVSNAADAYKQSPQHQEKGMNILRVPTVIIFENTKEVGRIVEYPVLSLEKDLLAILQQKNYIPNYAIQSTAK